MRIPATQLFSLLLTVALGACDPDAAMPGQTPATPGSPPPAPTPTPAPGPATPATGGIGGTTPAITPAQPTGTTTLPPFTSGLSPAARIDLLPAADSDRLCTAVQGALKRPAVVIDGLCAAAGTNAALKATPGEEQSSCSAARTECQQLFSQPTGPCDFSSCTGTVGELERCLDATRAYLACAAQSYPTCEALGRSPSTTVTCNITEAMLAVGLACKGGCSGSAPAPGMGMTPPQMPVAPPAAPIGASSPSADPRLAGAWVVRSVYFVDDTGALDFEVGSSLSSSLVGQSMNLASDGRFSFGPNRGAWTSAPLTRADRDRWMGTGAADDKLVLTWDGGQVDGGPIYESGAPSLPWQLHIYFRMTSPRAGQAVVTFGRTLSSGPVGVKK